MFLERYNGFNSFSFTLYLNGVPASLFRSYVPSLFTFATVYGPAKVSKWTIFQQDVSEHESYLSCSLHQEAIRLDLCDRVLRILLPIGPIYAWYAT
jgi:hypothetical protein